MSNWPVVRLGDDLRFLTSGSRGWATYYRDDGAVFLRIQNVRNGRLVLDDIAFVQPPQTAEARRTRVMPGDVLLSITADLGRTAVIPDDIGDAYINQHLAILRPRRLDPRFLSAYLASPLGQTQIARLNRQGVKAGLNFEDIRSLTVPIPPLPEQRRLAEVLDRAEALQSKRLAAIAQLDILTQSIFLEIFGDPAINPKGWPIRSVKDMAIKISDGPFGSNLKTSHYTPRGVRVIRLANIGVGKFLDHDAVFVSDEHFKTLRKNECLPGDVLVGTMGDPNLRACIQPDWLPVALNKADCVQIRANRAITTAPYICALLNLPSVERMAQELILGETRLRISMGRLRTLLLPVPPLSLQRQFVERLSAVQSLTAIQHDSAAGLDSLFASLQRRAFGGEL